jgi:hypothetical protein
LELGRVDITGLARVLLGVVVRPYRLQEKCKKVHCAE